MALTLLGGPNRWEIPLWVWRLEMEPLSAKRPPPSSYSIIGAGPPNLICFHDMLFLFSWQSSLPACPYMLHGVNPDTPSSRVYFLRKARQRVVTRRVESTLTNWSSPVRCLPSLAVSTYLRSKNGCTEARITNGFVVSDSFISLAALYYLCLKFTLEPQLRSNAILHCNNRTTGVALFPHRSYGPSSPTQKVSRYSSVKSNFKFVACMSSIKNKLMEHFKVVIINKMVDNNVATSSLKSLWLQPKNILRFLVRKWHM